MGKNAPQGLTPRRQWEVLGEDDGLVLARAWDGIGEGLGYNGEGMEAPAEIAKKCKKNAKKCNFICIYQKKVVSLHRNWEWSHSQQFNTIELWKEIVFLSARKAMNGGICIGTKTKRLQEVVFIACIAVENGMTGFHGFAMRWH